MNFYKKIESWYQQHKRDLPWRETSNPYFVWLSEIILQQTRIQQGLDYYLKFVAHYPTVFDLANASEEQVLKDWQGLGYYSRARNLHTAAKYIVSDLEGKFPSTYKEILKLKGVGDYTASAIASICFNEKTAVVDGNVYRVLSRYFGIETPINSTKGIKEFKTLAQELIRDAQPKEYNQGLMDFGSMLCRPQNPDCMFCPLQETCFAFRNGKMNHLPVKEKKLKIKKRYFNFIVFIDGAHTVLEQRTDKGIWQGLYQFPLIETDKQASEQEIKNLSSIQGFKNLTLHNPDTWVHKLTHQHLHTHFWIVEKDLSQFKNKTFIKDIEKFPVPRLIDKFLKESPIFSTINTTL